METKICSHCKEKKELNMFFKDCHQKDGYRVNCKKCSILYLEKQEKIIVETKKCSKCGKIKPASNFCKSKNTKNGLRSYCKGCHKEESKLYRKENKIKVKEYRESRKEKQKEYSKEYNKKNKEKLKENHKKYYIENHEKFLKINKKYREEHTEEMKKYKKEWEQKNMKKLCEKRKKFNKDNPHIYAWRVLLNNTLKRIKMKKSDRTIIMLGYSSEDLKNYIATLFTEGMSWDNYGEWHLDHIKPVSKFDPETPVSVVCALENLQPLWETDNLKKGSKY